MVDPIALLRLTIRYVITNRLEVLDYMSGAHGFKTYVVVKSQFLSTSICSKGFFWKWSMTMYHPLDYYVHRNNMGNWWKNSGILRLAPSQHVFIWLGPSTGGSPKTIGFNTKIGLMTWMIWVYPYFRKPPYIIYIYNIHKHTSHTPQSQDFNLKFLWKKDFSSPFRSSNFPSLRSKRLPFCIGGVHPYDLRISEFYRSF